MKLIRCIQSYFVIISIILISLQELLCNEMDYREIGKLLSYHCLVNVTQDVVICSNKFNYKIKEIMSDTQHEDAVETECCALWSWRDCVARSVSESILCNQTDIHLINNFPAGSQAEMFISVYCQEYPAGSDKCGPFAVWKIILICISSTIVFSIFAYCFIECIRYKCCSKKRGNKKESDDNKSITRF